MYQIIFNAIIPIFAVIALGYLLKKYGVISDEWAEPANTVTYYVAIPAMLFRAMTKQDLSGSLLSGAGLIILSSLFLALFVSLIFAGFKRLSGALRATFIHSSVHGNIGYMAYAVGFYGLGEKGFHNVVLLSSVLIIAQNTLAVLIFVFNEKSSSFSRLRSMVIGGICANPIIVSVTAGILWSVLGFELPSFASRFMDIVASMGLPTALILIGSSLTFSELRRYLWELTVINLIKLVVMPVFGLVVMYKFAIPGVLTKPLIILLGAPTATVTYVMARHLKGDPQLASTAVSLSTLLCAVTYSILIALV